MAQNFAGSAQQGGDPYAINSTIPIPGQPMSATPYGSSQAAGIYQNAPQYDPSGDLFNQLKQAGLASPDATLAAFKPPATPLPVPTSPNAGLPPSQQAAPTPPPDQAAAASAPSLSATDGSAASTAAANAAHLLHVAHTSGSESQEFLSLLDAHQQHLLHTGGIGALTQELNATLAAAPVPTTPVGTSPNLGATPTATPPGGAATPNPQPPGTTTQPIPNSLTQQPDNSGLLARLTPYGVTDLKSLQTMNDDELRQLSTKVTTGESRNTALNQYFFKNPDGTYDFSKDPSGNPTGMSGTGGLATPAPGTVPHPAPPPETPGAPVAPAPKPPAPVAPKPTIPLASSTKPPLAPVTAAPAKPIAKPNPVAPPIVQPPVSKGPIAV